MALPLEQIKILRAFTEGDSDFCYGYKYFEDETGLDRKTLKKHMTDLRNNKYVYYARGLMNDDGEVAGSGFGMEYNKLDLIWEIVENAPDAAEYELRKDIDEILRWNGVYDYQKRGELVPKLMKRFTEYTQAADLSGERKASQGASS